MPPEAVAGPGFTPELLASELPRFGQEYGPEAYRRLVEISTRFLTRSLRLVARYRDEYLSGLLPPGRMAEAGLPSMVPPPPDRARASDWRGWYQLFSAWVTEQQAWSARLYRVLLEEVAAGALRPEDVQASAREYLQRRLPDYLADMAELNAELVSDILAVADGSVDALSDVLVGRPDPGRSDPGPPDPEEMTIDVRGPAGSTASAALLIENSRREPAGVECLVTPAEGFGLVTAPMEFRLDAGESRTVAVRVALPAEPSGEPRAAGSVIIRGQGDRDLVVRVRALVEGPSAAGPVSAEPRS